jgi:hypothetical protein
MFCDNSSRTEGAVVIRTLFHVTRDIKKFQESFADHHSSTYVRRGVGVEGRIMDDKGSILNVDGPSVLRVVCGPPELERKFEIVLLAESARTELKSSANESERADLPIPVLLTPFRLHVGPVVDHDHL